MKFSIIFPCYNESKNILEIVEIVKKLSKQYDVEFIMVENGSTDNSRRIFKAFKVPCVRKVYIDKNRGYGYGIKQGIEVATGDYVGWMHADLQYNPLDLAKYFDYIINHDNNNSDGHLLLKGNRCGRTLTDKFFTLCMGLVDSIIFKTWMKEVMSSPTIVHRDLLGQCELLPSNFSIDIYVYVLAKRMGFTVVHLPIKENQRKNGNSSWNFGLKTRIKMSKTLFLDSIRIRRELSK